MRRAACYAFLHRDERDMMSHLVAKVTCLDSIELC